MHKLARNVRFSINPFLPEDNKGFNPFASGPAGEGLAIFFELSVGLVGEVDKATGFIINVLDIDKRIFEYVLPIFSGRLRENFRRAEHTGFVELYGLLKAAGEKLADKFKPAMLAEIGLKLNPFRKIAFDCEDFKMVYFSEKFEFAATHKLWNDEFSEQRNFEVFGKCANPAGHGHNYIVEVIIKAPADENNICIGKFENVVDSEFIKLVDHKNLNADVSEFSRKNPTVENIAVFAWDRLVGKFESVKLHCITVWETDRTHCSYYG